MKSEDIQALRAGELAASAQPALDKHGVATHRAPDARPSFGSVGAGGHPVGEPDRNRVAAVAPGPAQIRALRGELSRAAFARRLSVTALTVYRWELPESAREARRPRGQVLSRLRAYTATPLHLPPEPADALARPVPSSAIERDEYERLLPVLEHIPSGELRRAENELLQLLASGELRTRAARALAGQGLARLCVIARADGRAAFTTLAPILHELEHAGLPPEVELAVHVTAALAFSSPDGRLFDAGKTTVHVRRAERLLDAHGSAEDRLLLWIAQFAVAFVLNDQQLFERVIARREEVLHGHARPVPRAIALLALAIESYLSGRSAQAARRFEELAELSQAPELSVFKTRALTHLADGMLEDAGDPRAVLELTERAHVIAQDHRHGLSIHSLVACHAQGEALLRMARFDEAEQRLMHALQLADELAWTPITVGLSLARLYAFTGRSQQLRALAERLARYDKPVQRAITHAEAASMQALAGLMEGAEPSEAFAAFARAEQLGQDGVSWGFLSRSIVLLHLESRVLFDDLATTQLAIGHGERLLDVTPSVWADVQLRHHKGILLCRQGRVEEGKKTLEAALASFELAGLVPEAARSRLLLARLAIWLGDPEGEALRERAEAELKRLGMIIPLAVRPETSDPRASERAARRERGGIASLVVPIQRLSVRGMSPALIQRELVTVLDELFPAATIRLDEIDSQGAGRLLAEVVRASAGRTEAIELGDGSGRRLRLTVTGSLADDAHHALSTVASVAALALEVATLRGFAEPPGPHGKSLDAPPELPGFVAASAAMRALKLDLARLSRSRSTVIVTGESGTGKEIVARAIHDLSARAAQPFIAFNCAATPRELFEGQLFGYKRGAYTGANADHPGVIRCAGGGTLFLDEVGELPLDVQPKLLRFLENGEIFPLGERRAVQVDVRVVAATHRDLELLVREGRFREDLFYRLQVVPVRIPPLSERREDIVALARHFLRALTPVGQEPPVLSPGAITSLLAHRWPGNARELRNVIERSLAYAPVPRVLDADHLRA